MKNANRPSVPLYKNPMALASALFAAAGGALAADQLWLSAALAVASAAIVAVPVIRRGR